MLSAGAFGKVGKSIDNHTIHPDFLQINSPPVFFVLFFLYFLREFVAAPIFCNSHALLGESRGYCTKTKQEWPDSGSTLENIFCSFCQINSSQEFFCIAKTFGVDGKHNRRRSKIHIQVEIWDLVGGIITSAELLARPSVHEPGFNHAQSSPFQKNPPLLQMQPLKQESLDAQQSRSTKPFSVGAS